METNKRIKRALISVYHKDKLEKILSLLQRHEVEMVSTGGTQAFIQSLGYPCTAVEDYTGYPSILGGRVKTLHPAIMGGLLARRGHEEDERECEMYDIPAIDLVIVDLYPFKETLHSNASHEEIIEKIDVGGVSLIRAAAKNYKDVLLCPAREYYGELEAILERSAESTLQERLNMAGNGFALSSEYDKLINDYLNSVWLDKAFEEIEFKNSLSSFPCTHHPLRYGENPHQMATFCGELDEVIHNHSDRSLSYNNLLDIDAAISLMADLGSEQPAFGIFKHNNPCGLAVGKDLKDAFQKALAADPQSAFGGVFIAQQPIDEETAAELDKLFFEVLLAPDFLGESKSLLMQKKKRILISYKAKKLGLHYQWRGCLNGSMKQERDLAVEQRENLCLKTAKAATEEEINDLLLANVIVKHCKSNAIVLLKDGQMIGAGVGQASRIDALKQASEKAKRMGFETGGAVLASDAFFPFRDCVDTAASEGITAIIQPGGSIRDEESISAADEHRLAMYFTGVRHFKH